MKIFTVAVISNKCFGHGDYANVRSIEPLGAYGTGSFPPCFYTEAEAGAWIKQARPHDGRLAIVELDLITPSKPTRTVTTYK